MKKIHFIICSFLLLALSITVTAKEKVFENIKTEFVNSQDIQSDYVAVSFDFTFNAVPNFDHHYLVKPSGGNPNSFAIITDVSWQSNQLVSHYSIYKNQLTANYLIDKRKLLEISGIKYKQLSC